MAERRNPPKRPTSFAADAAIFLAAALFSMPVLASGSHFTPCPQSELPTLDVSPDALVTVTVSHDVSYVASGKVVSEKQSEIANPPGLLAPRAEAAIREAFRDSATASDPAPAAELIEAVVTPPMAGTESEIEETDDDARIETPAGMTTRLPGVSDDDLSRFKKQMFRRDI